MIDVRLKSPVRFGTGLSRRSGSCFKLVERSDIEKSRDAFVYRIRLRSTFNQWLNLFFIMSNLISGILLFTFATLS